MDSLFYFVDVVVVIVDYQRNAAHKNKSSDWCMCVCLCMWLSFPLMKKTHNICPVVRFTFNYSCICYNKILNIENVNDCVSRFFSNWVSFSGSSFSFMKINRATFFLSRSIFYSFVFTHSPVRLSQPHLFWKPLFLLGARAVALKRWPWF